MSVVSIFSSNSQPKTNNFRNVKPLFALGQRKIVCSCCGRTIKMSTPTWRWESWPRTVGVEENFLYKYIFCFTVFTYMLVRVRISNFHLCFSHLSSHLTTQSGSSAGVCFQFDKPWSRAHNVLVLRIVYFEVNEKNNTCCCHRAGKVRKFPSASVWIGHLI